MSKCLNFLIYVALSLKLSCHVVWFCFCDDSVSDGGDVLFCRGIDLFVEFFNHFDD